MAIRIGVLVQEVASEFMVVEEFSLKIKKVAEVIGIYRTSARSASS